jgi:hypothetical protein
MAGAAEIDDGPRAGRWRTLLVALALGIAFVAVSATFAWLLKPLVTPSAVLLPIRPAPTASTAGAPAANATRPAIATPGAAPPRPPVAVPKGPLLAVLVTDFPDRQADALAMIDRVPAGVAVALAPDHPALAALAARARQRGLELWLGLPLEPKNYPVISPGPNTLTRDAGTPENLRRLEKVLAQVPRPAGLYTMMGSAFTADQAAMQPVAQAIARRGLPLIDSRVIGATVAARNVADAGGKSLSNALFLDDEPRRDAIRRKLDRLARTAVQDGRAVTIARALPATMDALAAFDQKAAGVTMVNPTVLLQ